LLPVFAAEPARQGLTPRTDLPGAPSDVARLVVDRYASGALRHGR
jgi:hypothetical protein